MRIWSLHPKYLDAKGLVALWRETLLAKNVLEGKTKGYKNHPQLQRFKKLSNPVDAVNQYLTEIFFEAERREYHFSREKINWAYKRIRMPVTKGQLDYEVKHLLNKLSIRDAKKYNELVSLKKFEAHSLFSVEDGGIADWEISGRK